MRDRPNLRRASLRTVLLGLSLGALPACFSGADFSDCSEDIQCGSLRVCVANACVFAEDAPDTDVRTDAGADAAENPDVIRIAEGPINRDISFPGKTVVLGDHTIASTTITIEARVIEVRGTLSADGVGGVGGLGGGGGGAGHPTVRFPGGTAPFVEPEVADPLAGRASTGDSGGSGGPGQRGTNLAGGTPGQPGSSPDAPDGQPGNPARLLPAGNNVCDNPGLIQVGSGGGGGGGGRGGNARACQSGIGGGAGGNGGAGGGYLTLVASERIVVAGRISARGLPAPAMPANAAAGGPACGDPELSDTGSAECAGDCDASRHGFGGHITGDGPGPGEPSQPGGESGRAGAGGVGGPGSGGMIRIDAPQVVLEPGHGFDLSGGDPNLGSEFGGALVLPADALAEVNPVVLGAATTCFP